MNSIPLININFIILRLKIYHSLLTCKIIFLINKIAVDNQIEHLLRAYYEIRLDFDGEFIVYYHKLLHYYNDQIIEKDKSVSFGHVMSLMKKKGIILPPSAPTQNKIVIFCGNEISKFLQIQECRCIIYFKIFWL